jgi:hypothetical protein
MSLRVRSTLALCTAAVLVSLGSGAASAADDPAPLVDPCLLSATAPECAGGGQPAQETPPTGTTEDADGTQEPAQDPADPSEEPAGTAPLTDGLADAGLGEQSPGAVGEAGSGDAGTGDAGSEGAGSEGAGSEGAGSEESAEESAEDEGEQPPATEEDAPDIEGALDCLAAVGEDFVTEFLAQLEAVEPGLAEELAGIGSLEELVAALDGGDLQVSGETLTAVVDEAIAQLEAGSEEFRACLEELIPVEPPTGGNPPPAQPVTNPAPQQPQYANCDDARAKGAAPVHAGQPGYGPHLDSDHDGVGCEQETAAVSYTHPTAAPQLAYTGFDVWPFAGAGAAMLVLGSALVAGARRSS